jgi:hypothetical protein
MTNNKEIMILSAVLLIVLPSVKVVYGIPTTLESAKRRAGITNRQVSIGIIHN